ncbi:hypothetical protein BAY61_19280 [Prauserella marina]|uniref:Uncharacterized protein n=1 Tax=Prauserella marina TaxID=530584 RepID=A0A222VS98_9PSEU|nr:hypothetical protein [Prauserella marina]ASR36784.1 hypothetical protein BAY61_19280 [Prauserella marina]PWV80317.1 hypothetical protein DES30_103408 [Prauserella marina]SDD51671.1 hypothetical protein SAMN05421630_109193 [Prauserella marina]
MNSAPAQWQPTAEERHRAARAIAHHATGAADLAELLDMLGLGAEEGRTPPERQDAPVHCHAGGN